jgi:hypothetical protein
MNSFSNAGALAEHLDLKDAIHVGHSTGGGEVLCAKARMTSWPQLLQ